MNYQMPAAMIRSARDWGCKGGLLSEAEVALLIQLVREGPSNRVLEVGHYYGLSTAAIALGIFLRDDGPGRLVSFDSHEADGWVPNPAPVTSCVENIRGLKVGRTRLVHRRSQGIVKPIRFPVVFYDGDHAEEQYRFTELVVASPEVRLFMFDDRDFVVPVRCEALLLESGWVDESPEVFRGGGDKANPDTMSLGVWRRP